MKNVIDFMRNNTRVLSLLSAVLFFLFPQIGFGASSAFTVPSTDLSVILLGKIFGTVGGGLETGGSSILGKMFYVFNSGILVIIGMILIYIVGRSIFEISHGDVSQMGRKFSGWQVARVVLGTGSVVPQATGYSAINVMIMWVVIQGVGMANAVWKQAVTYIAEGNSFYVMDKKNITNGGVGTLIDNKFIKPDAASQVGTCEKTGGAGCVTAKELMKAQICMNSLYRAVEDYRVFNVKTLAKKASLTAREKEIYDILSHSVPRFREAYYGKVASSDIRGSYRVEFPGNASAVPFAKENSLGVLDSASKNYNGVCGVYSWGKVPVQEGKETDQENYRSVKETALRSLILSLSNASLASIETYKPFDSTVATISITCPVNAKSNTTGFYPCTYLFPDHFQQSTYTSMVYGVANYQSTILPMRNYAGRGYSLKDTAKSTAGETKSMIDDLTTNGWLGAGSFYLRLINVDATSGYEANKDTNYYPNIVQLMSRNLEDHFKNYGEIGKKYYDIMKNRHEWLTVKDSTDSNVFKQASELADKMNEASKKATGGLNLPQVLNEFAQGTDGKTINIRPPVGAGSMGSFVLDPLNAELKKVLIQWKTVFDPLSSEGKNKLPLLRLHELGKTMIASCFNYWNELFTKINTLMSIYFGTSVGFTIVSGILAPFSSLGLAVGGQLALQQAQSLLEMTSKMFVEIPLMILLPMVTPITLILLLNGVLLAYYIPLLPFMLFLFGTVTWFSFVIEGMVAGPLIALGVTHPEGHDLMGKAEQTLMLLVSLFVRPTVMIFGLIAGLLLSYVGLEVLNATFGALLNGTFSVGSGDALIYVPKKYLIFNGVYSEQLTATAQVQNVAFILIYTFIVMSLMQQCFSLIHSLPSSVMMWIGGPHKEGQEAQLAGEVKSNVSQTADRAGSGVGSSASAAQGLSSVSSGRVKVKDKKEENKSSITETGAGAGDGGTPSGGAGGGST